MADFQQSAMQGGLLLILFHGALFRTFSVSGEENTVVSEDGLQDERVVIAGLGSGVVAGLGGQDSDVDLAETKDRKSVV